MLTPAAMSIVMTTYAGRQRAPALALWGTVASMGIAAGVLFGGILTTAFDWRAIFFINIPIGVAAAVQTVRLVQPEHRAGGVRGLDVPGAASAVTGLLALVYGIEGTRTHGWASAHTLLAFAASAALLAAFAVIERRVPAPLVPPATWRVRSLISASTVMAVITGAVVGVIFLSSLFLQSVLGSSAVVTGLQFLPLAGSITLGAAVASHLLGKLSPKAMMVVGLLVVAAGAMVLAGIGSDPSYAADVLPGFVLVGLGVGPMFVAISVAAMAGIPEDHAGLASGVMMTGHEVGAALGVAILTAVAGDITTSKGLLDAFPQVFTVVAIAMLALAAFAAVVVPRQQGQHTHHAGMH
jgi:MFS family permease